MSIVNETRVDNVRTRRAEDNVPREREFLYAVLDSIEEPIVACDTKGAVKLINRAARELNGRSAEQVLLREWPERYPPYRSSEEAELMAADITDVVQTLPGEQIWNAEQVPKTLFGDDLALLTNARALHDASGNMIGAVATLRAVTEEKLSRETHRHLTAERDSLLLRLELHIERMPLAYILFDVNCRVIDWNPAAEKIFGYKKEEVLGLGPSFEKLVPSSTRPKDETLGRIRFGEMAAHSVNENLTKDGRTITCEWYNTPLIEDDGRFGGMFSLVQDITERKGLEEQLRQSQKMEAVGQLAGGIAHDFNNLLTIIIGYSDLMLASLTPNGTTWEMLEEIRKAGERAASLTRQLLTFSKKQVLAPEILDLNEVVRDTEKMLHRVIGEDIQFETILYPDLYHVKADPGQLEQVLLNLAVNARDAMPQGGKLTIESKNVVIDDCSNDHADVQASQYVMLAVTDTGDGMTEDVKQRIFEPFFTTKEIGKGTGLGLAVVHGVVKQSDGYIEVESKPERGASFRIFLPRVERAMQSTPTFHDPVLVPGGVETILLVEDEDIVRGVARRVLQGCGYTILEAGCADEASKVCEEFTAPIHLLVSDVVMPGIGGRALAERLLTQWPGMKVLFVSGYMDDAIVRHGIIQEEVAFLAKPYSPLALANKVREVLDARKPKPREATSLLSALSS